MPLPRTSGAKIALYNVETGQRTERWPVDAREMLARGGWSLTPAGQEPIEDVEAALRVAPPAAAVNNEAALIDDAAALSPTGAPLNVVREGVSTAAGASVSAAVPMSKRVR